MCWWSVAIAAAPNINAPMREEGGQLAYQSAARAVAFSGGVSELERALIEAAARRYAPEPGAERAPLDSAYAMAMERVAASHAHDPDVLTPYGAALMNPFADMIFLTIGDLDIPAHIPARFRTL